MLTHAIEAFVSTGHNDFSDAAAEKAIKLVKRYLLKCYKEPNDLEARQGMHNASCLAGIAFSNAGLGLNHGMAHALGAHFHIPHGRANGILLPYVMSFNAGCADSLTPTVKRYAQIARLMRLESSSIRQSALNMIRTTRQYMEKLTMPSTIQVAGVSHDRLCPGGPLHRHQPSCMYGGGHQNGVPQGVYWKAALTYYLPHFTPTQPVGSPSLRNRQAVLVHGRIGMRGRRKSKWHK